MKLKNFIFAVAILLISQSISAQRNYGGYNFLGITGGLTFFDINTDDFVTSQSTGFMAGFSARGAFRNDFDLIYGLTVQNSQVSIQASNAASTQFVDYSLLGAQIHFMGSYNIVVKHLSIEFGPVLNVNGKLNLEQEQFEDYVITGYNELRAQDILDISKIDFRVAAGITAGFEHFRISGQYQYGVTNMLNNLNEQNLEINDFKGNSSTLIVSGVIYF
ncbi:PorT family protein [Aequorivita echinoideorum]|uniref:PorT family protein n=1 Tax=Aequorivita echinoideorum TaxID=1549647 RepID=A0ABS5S422_9FLAO|nr:PorT family protein [Aequorivita echinoideorum]MBT0607137.1 PorT family protein [Aequorivita echinoideorum]